MPACSVPSTGTSGYRRNQPWVEVSGTAPPGLQATATFTALQVKNALVDLHGALGERSSNRPGPIPISAAPDSSAQAGEGGALSLDGSAGTCIRRGWRPPVCLAPAEGKTWPPALSA